MIDMIIEEINNDHNKVVDNDKTDFEREAELNTEHISRTVNEESTKNVLFSNCLIFFFAGFDTTSTGFAVCCHFLAKHQHIQVQTYLLDKECIFI